MIAPGWFYPVVAVFAAVVTVALLMQFAMLAGIYLAVRRLQQHAEDLLQSEIRPMMADSKAMLHEVRQRLDEWSQILQRIEYSTRLHVDEANTVITEATHLARREVERADHMVSEALDRVERAGHRVERVVTAPGRLVRGAARGVKRGVRGVGRRLRGRRMIGCPPVEMQPRRPEDDVITREAA